MIKIDLKRHRKEIIGSVVVLLILLGGMSVFKYTSFNSGFEIVDDLGGNIFPSAILSVATTDAQVIVPSDSNYLGNPKSCIAVRVKSKTAYSRVRIEVAETPFFSRSVSEFVLNKPRTEYTIYPDIIWNYEALKNEVQAEPVSVAITVEMNGKDLGQRVRTFSVRSINECMLSFLAERNVDGYVPGITNIIEGGYQQKDGSTALSAAEKIERGKTAIGALAAYRAAKSAGHEEDAQIAYKVLQENIPYFGYGYIKDVNQLVPNVPLNFYAFRVMVILGGYFILFFIVVLFFIYKKDLSQMRWMHWIALLTIPLGYIAGQAGWVVAECGRQPWAIRDMLPTMAAISKLDVSSVQTTFFIFLLLFTVMLIAGVGIMVKAIKKGPEN